MNKFNILVLKVVTHLTEYIELLILYPPNGIYWTVNIIQNHNSGFQEPLISQKFLLPGNTHFQNPSPFPNLDFYKSPRILR